MVTVTVRGPHPKYDPLCTKKQSAFWPLLKWVNCGCAETAILTNLGSSQIDLAVVKVSSSWNGASCSLRCPCDIKSSMTLHWIYSTNSRFSILSETNNCSMIIGLLAIQRMQHMCFIRQNIYVICARLDIKWFTCFLSPSLFCRNLNSQSQTKYNPQTKTSKHSQNQPLVLQLPLTGSGV